jgi:hypothetical protein
MLLLGPQPTVLVAPSSRLTANRSPAPAPLPLAERVLPVALLANWLAEGLRRTRPATLVRSRGRAKLLSRGVALLFQRRALGGAGPGMWRLTGLLGRGKEHLNRERLEAAETVKWRRGGAGQPPKQRWRG